MSVRLHPHEVQAGCTCCAPLPAALCCNLCSPDVFAHLNVKAPDNAGHTSLWYPKKMFKDTAEDMALWQDLFVYHHKCAGNIFPVYRVHQSSGKLEGSGWSCHKTKPEPNQSQQDQTRPKR
jgi:hypothetical protein